MTTAVLDNKKTAQITKIMNEARAAVEKIKNDAPQQFPEAASIGDAVRQGDIYIQLIADDGQTPMLYQQVAPNFPFQLADGDTKGSRHCLAHGNGVTAYKPVKSGSREMLRQLATQYKNISEENLSVNSVQNAEWAAKARENPDIMTLNEALSFLEFTGPIFRLAETNTVTHPEHGDWILPPGCYRVTYQRTISRENVISRVID